MMERLRVLFVCMGNSCRSQMAEGWTRHLRGDQIDAYSAGIERHGLNRVAVKVMAESGVDISTYQSKRIEDLPFLDFDYVVTVCDDAQESCPTFPGSAVVLHWGFDDPPRLARMAPSDEAALDVYRRVRDQIRSFVESLPDAITNP